MSTPKYKRFDGNLYKRYRKFMIKQEATQAAKGARYSRGKKIYNARVTKEGRGWVIWLHDIKGKYDNKKIKFKGKEWDLWTEIPPWSDYLPFHAEKDAKKHYPETATKRQSKYGRVYVQILVRGKRKTKGR